MSYSISEANFKANKTGILELWGRNYPDLPSERFNWIYEKNPAGPAECWVAKHKDKELIVGAIALFYRRIFINGEQSLAGISGDYIVDKEHRAFGPAMKLQKKLFFECDKKEGLYLIYGLPNKSSEAIHLRLGYKIIGEILTLTKPLNFYNYIKRNINIPVITKLMSKLFDIAFRFFSKEYYYRGQDKYAIYTPEYFDERFDKFWEIIKSQVIIIGERSSSYLNWRYIQSPHKKYYIFSLVGKVTSELRGYIIYYNDKNRVKIDDIVSIDTSQTMNFMLAKFIQYQREKKMESISVSFLENNTYFNKLKSFGFSSRNIGVRLVVYTPGGGKNLVNFMEKENWHFFLGDNDI